MTAPGSIDLVYDISILDGLRAKTYNRAGIFRVVDRVALELARREDCRLAFSCSNQILRVSDVRAAAAAEYPELERVPGVDLWLPTPELQALLDGLQGLRKRPGEGLLRKLRRKALRIRHSMLRDRFVFREEALPRGGVYHSPWEPLPPARHFAARDVRRVITIYDMTPRLFPHFFEDTKVFDSILASIVPTDHVIAISECTKRDFCEVTGHDPARVHVTPLAADAAMFRPVAAEAIREARARYGLGDRPYLLSVNTLQPRKNLERCIEAFTRLVRQERLEDLVLVLVGDRGWKTRDIDAALRRTGLGRDQLRVTGYVPDADLAPLYSGALAFVYVSLYEGFGLPPLEAMQCGVPVIAASTSSVPEVVGDAGLLVDPLDVDGIAAAMRRLRGDAALRAELAGRAKARAAGFSWARCGDLTVDAYRRARAG